MSFSVLNNVSGLQAQNELTVSSWGMNKTLWSMSSGKRINSGADDAAGLAIADGLKGQVNGLNQAVRNASDGIGYLQTADGALGQITSLLHRAITLAETAATSTNSSQTAVINSEYTQIKNEIDRIEGNTYYNGTDVLGTALTVFVGDTTSTSTINATTTGWSVTALNLGMGTVDSAANATSELAKLKIAVQSVAGYRGDAGAVMNRLKGAQQVIMTQTQNLTAAESGIRDANMAQVMSDMTKFQILNQAGMSALSQANSSAQSVLSLFR